MRQSILSYLLAHRGEFISGQRLSEELGITRTAVWKHICMLREKGYTIDSYTKKGYCLTGVPDLLDPEAVSKKVHTSYIGKNVVYEERTASTNTVAKDLAHKGAVEGTVVISEEQNGGKGRLDRSFFSPYAKGIWFSVILRPDFPPVEVSKMTLLTAVALTRVFRSFGLEKCVIKWPNDILVDGKKLVGILTELSATMEKVNYVVTGMGINTSFTRDELPADLQDKATSFLIEGVTVGRNELWQAVMEELERYYEMAKHEGFSCILDEWRSLSVTFNQDVEIVKTQGVTYGKAVDIDDDGNLIVVGPDGPVRIVAGDVRIRPKK